MLNQIPMLSMLIWLPVVGAIVVLWLSHQGLRDGVLRSVGLSFALLTLFLTIPLCLSFDNNSAAMQFVENLNWLPMYGIRYHLGVDGISLPLIVLTCFTTVLVIIGSWKVVHEKVAQYLAAFLVMQSMVVGVFSSLDAVLFYFFWEGMLIPMYLSIGIWGGINRSMAAIKFFIYTFVGSAILLVAILYLRQMAGSFNILDFYALHFDMQTQLFLFFAFLLAFGVKIPLWPLHTWLPDAHTEAPAGGSVVLAALMLKIGAYGFLRFSMPIVPDACHAMSGFMVLLSLIAIVYVGLIAIAQTDMKKLIAYSSISHMGFVTLGCFIIYYIILPHTNNYADAYLVLQGSIMQMITHAFSSGAMFLAFGLLYQQLRTRLIKNFGGIAHVMPYFTAFFIVFAMSNVALPGTAGFVGEFMILLGTVQASFWVMFIAATTLVIGAVYTLWMVRRVFYGPVIHDQVAKLEDISGSDYLIFGLLAIVVLVVGIYPHPILNMMHASVGHLLALSQRSHL